MRGCRYPRRIIYVPIAFKLINPSFFPFIFPASRLLQLAIFPVPDTEAGLT